MGPSQSGELKMTNSDNRALHQELSDAELEMVCGGASNEGGVAPVSDSLVFKAIRNLAWSSWDYTQNRAR
jgi:hypothetical protein